MMSKKEKSQHIHILRWANLGEAIICVHDRCGFELSRLDILDIVGASATTSVFEILQSEISWHKNNRGMCEEDYEKGFLAGLLQARNLLSKSTPEQLSDMQALERVGKLFIATRVGSRIAAWGGLLKWLESHRQLDNETVKYCTPVNGIHAAWCPEDKKDKP